MAELVASIIALAGSGAALARSLYGVADAITTGNDSTTTTNRDARLVAAEVAVFAHSLSELTHHLGTSSSPSSPARKVREVALPLHDACGRVLDDLRAEIPGGVDAVVRRRRHSSPSSSSFSARVRWLFHKPKMRHLRLEMDSLKMALVLVVAALNYDEAARSEAPLAITDPLREHVSTFLLAASDAAARVLDSSDALSSAAHSDLHNDFRDLFFSDADKDNTRYVSAPPGTFPMPSPTTTTTTTTNTDIHPSSSSSTTTTTTTPSLAPPPTATTADSSDDAPPRPTTPMTPVSSAHAPAAQSNAPPPPPPLLLPYSPAWQSSGRAVTAQRVLGEKGPAFDALSEALGLRAQRCAYLFALGVMEMRPPAAKWTWEAVRGAGKKGVGGRLRRRRGEERMDSPMREAVGVEEDEGEDEDEDGEEGGSRGSGMEERRKEFHHTNPWAEVDLAARLARLEEILAGQVEGGRREKDERASNAGSAQNAGESRRDEPLESDGRADGTAEEGAVRKEEAPGKGKEAPRHTEEMETKVNTPPREAEPIKDDIEHHKVESRNAEVGKEQSVSPRIGKPEEISPKTRPAHENVDLPRKEVQKTDVGIEKRDKVTEEGRIRDQKPITALRSPFNPSRSKTARSQHVTQSQEEDVDLHPGFRLPSLSASRMARQAEIHRPRTRTASLDIPRKYPSTRTLPRPAPAPISVLNEPASPAVSTAASTRTVSQPVMARSMYNQSNISISTDPMGTGLQRQIPSRLGKDWHRYKKADGYQT